jgi:hypothetical protein
VRTKQIIALLALLLLLAGCETRGGRGEPFPTEPATESTTEPETEAPTTEPETEPTEAETEPVDTEGVTAAVDNLLAALQSGSADAIREQIDYRNLLLLDDGSPEDSLLAILKKLDYEILDVTVEESTASVTVSLSSVSVESFFMDYLWKCDELYFNNAQLGYARASDVELGTQTQQLFYDMLDANEQNRTETTVVIQL